ncbi:hypothetical protein CVT24_004293 [Panaeolus cyanescens]|uniref:Small-subunit processome Utp12 domain-containing protein n=1 Tax=Panaeolus cyanescens TaxID=181874 RepID=A0A409VA53_9AGAR|nr:hypothetical protein CVT24_004293 [Panaeolus cyanescens]
MASTRKAKATKSRPESTSALAQNGISSSSSLNSLFSAFSPDTSLFAVATLAVDRHRLRIYNTSTAAAVAEYTVENGQITSFTWGVLSLSKSSPQQDGSSPSKRKKKKVDNASSASESLDQVVVLGLSTGTILVFSPSQAKVVRKLSHHASTSAITSITFDPSKPTLVFSSTADSVIQTWDLEKDALVDNWKNDSRIPFTTVSIRPSSKDDKRFFVAAHHEIRLFSTSTTVHGEGEKPVQVASYTGHASSVKSIQWSSSSKFLSSAEGDRFIYLWDSDTATTNARPSASISLDADVRKSHCLTETSDKTVLATLSSSNKIFVVPIPDPLPKTVDTRQNTSTTPTLLPRATVSDLSKPSAIDAPILDLVLSKDKRTLLIARWVKGVRPVFDSIRYKDEDGEFIRNIMLEEVSTSIIENESQQLPVNKRYVEPTSLGVTSGLDIDQEDIDEFSAAQRDIDGALQVDLAQLSLGQRLAALTPGGPAPSNSDDEDAGAGVQSRKRSQNKDTVVPANSLTRTLIQALHSSDSRLLETCLTHSDPNLIRNTVKRLPPQLAIPLITACVDRLGRGGRGANMKGGGGASSSQRGSGLVTWITTVLTIHTGHLMTIPDLVARLSALHSTLTDRLSLHQSLLTLSGRLDMVLSQIDLRATSSASQGQQNHKPNKKKSTARAVTRYTEGDSESEDEGMDVEVEVDNDDDGSVEDIELGGDSESEEDESGSEEDLEGESEDEGFIDDEAEEADSDEEESD